MTSAREYSLTTSRIHSSGRRWRAVNVVNVRYNSLKGSYTLLDIYWDYCRWRYRPISNDCSMNNTLSCLHPIRDRDWRYEPITINRIWCHVTSKCYHILSSTQYCRLVEVTTVPIGVIATWNIALNRKFQALLIYSKQIVKAQCRLTVLYNWNALVEFHFFVMKHSMHCQHEKENMRKKANIIRSCFFRCPSACVSEWTTGLDGTLNLITIIIMIFQIAVWEFHNTPWLFILPAHDISLENIGHVILTIVETQTWWRGMGGEREKAN